MSGPDSVMKLQMTPYSDNAYDVTNSFCCFEKFLAYTLFLPGFIVVRHQMAELNWGGGGLPYPLLRYPGSIQNRVKIRIDKNNSLFHLFDAFSLVLPSFNFLSVIA